MQYDKFPELIFYLNNVLYFSPFFNVGKPIKKVLSEGNSPLENKGVPRRRVGKKGLFALLCFPSSKPDYNM